MALCVLTLLPSFVGPEKLPSWLRAVFDKSFNLGSDLRGGVQFVYSIDLNEAVRDKATEIKRSLDEHFAESERTAGKVELITPQTQIGVVNAKFADAALKEEIEAAFKAEYASALSPIECTTAASQSQQLCYRVSTAFAESTRRAALSHAVETIRERIDANGLAESNVVEKGDDIIVELPGLKKDKVASIRETIARTAKLEFRIVDEGGPLLAELYRYIKPAEGTGLATEPDAAAAGISGFFSQRNDAGNQPISSFWFTAADRDESVPMAQALEQGLKCDRDPQTDMLIVKNDLARCQVTGRQVIERYLAKLAATNPAFVIPDDRKLGFELSTDKDNREVWRTVYLESTVRLTGSSVSDAGVSYDQVNNHPEVTVKFNRGGQRLFAETTGNNVGRLMAIILDDRVRSAPEIKTRISSNASISVGGGSLEQQLKEANALVVVLKTGSLAAPLKEESFSEFGPTLGSDAIAKAEISFAVGILMVVAIMTYFYRFSGAIAIVVVFLNVFMMMAAMAVFGATLTLPGIAALVLTVGMAVDGNILIFERIRDELLDGKSVKGAVDAGFSRAFSAILDGQLTGAAGGWVLYMYGSGPIKGFAVMLLVGIATSLFTTTWVSRVFFDWYLAKKSDPSAISI